MGPKRAKGKPIVWTAAQLEVMANVSPADLEFAAALWRDRAPPVLKDLLDAEPQHINI